MKGSKEKRIVWLETSLEETRARVEAIDRYCDELKEQLARVEKKLYDATVQLEQHKKEGLTTAQVIDEWMNGGESNGQ